MIKKKIAVVMTAIMLTTIAHFNADAVTPSTSTKERIPQSILSKFKDSDRFSDWSVENLEKPSTQNPFNAVRAKDTVQYFTGSTSKLKAASINTTTTSAAISTAITVSNAVVSITEAREITVTVNLGYTPASLTDLTWTFGEKPFSDWKKYDTKAKKYSGSPFITFVSGPELNGQTLTAKIKFDLPYGTVNLSPRSIRVKYPELMGNYDLQVTDTKNNSSQKATMKLTVYDGYHRYEEIKPAIDEIQSRVKSGRYFQYKSLGKSVEGRDLHFVVLAKDKSSVDQYLNETLPMMLSNPAALKEKIENKTMGSYKVPIFFNNIHPDEAPGIDAIIDLLDQFASKDAATYKVYPSTETAADADGFKSNAEDTSKTPEVVNLNVNQVLDNCILLFDFTENPDGRYYNTRENANGFDVNRDNANQTQPESILVAGEISKWSPIAFLDFHGFVQGFLLEPCTTPHDPNYEYDLLADNMVEQARAMGKAGVSNTKYTNYEIPYLDYPGTWDDATPAYTATYAMQHGALGHTIEIPELNQDSENTLFYAGLAAVNYVTQNKDKLFKNQLEYFNRGIKGEDNKLVDPFFKNSKGDVIGRPRGANQNFFPEYYVLPVDAAVQKNPLEVYKMVEYLLRNGIKVEVSKEPVSVKGIIYPAGSYVVPMHQAKRGLANTALYDGANVSDFKELYAEIVLDLPDLRGFDRFAERNAGIFNGKTEKITSISIPKTIVTSTAEKYSIKNSNNDAIKAVNNLLNSGKTVEISTESKGSIDMGDYIVKAQDLNTVKDNYFLSVTPVKEFLHTKALVKPKILLSGTKHLAFVLKELGFDSNAADSNIVVADDDSDRKASILSGKPYIGIKGNALEFIKTSNLLPGFDYTSSTDFDYEGLLKSTVSEDSIVNAGYDQNELIYDTPATYITALPKKATVLAQVSDDPSFFKAGWWKDNEGAKGKPLSIAAKVGNTDIILFANNLVNKAHPQASYRMLANAIFASTSKLEADKYVSWKKTTSTAVPASKEWKITFSSAMDVSSLLNNVAIVNEATGETFPIKLTLSEDGKLLSITHEKSFQSGAAYILYVNGNTKSKDGKNGLKNGYKLRFTVQ